MNLETITSTPETQELLQYVTAPTISSRSRPIDIIIRDNHVGSSDPSPALLHSLSQRSIKYFSGFGDVLTELLSQQLFVWVLHFLVLAAGIEALVNMCKDTFHVLAEVDQSHGKHFTEAATHLIVDAHPESTDAREILEHGLGTTNARALT